MPRVVSPLFLVLLLLALAAGNASVYRSIFASPALAVTVLDVGEKGSATLVRSPSGKTLLIDAGADAGILRALGSALPMWQRRLDAVILTSAAKRAAGGLPDVESRYTISSLIRSAHRGDRFPLGDGVLIDVLWPPETPAPLNAATSPLILRISYGATSFVIQNELPPRAAAWLAAADADIPPANLTISSSTPKRTYLSNGTSIH